MMNWQLFPPYTRNLQFDEKWAFVYQKEKHSNGNPVTGDCWDYVAYDPDNKLVLSVVPGKRCAENTNKVVSEAKKRTGGRYMDMITSDEYPGYKPAILNNYGVPEIVCNKEDEPNDKKKQEDLKSLNWSRQNTLTTALFIKPEEKEKS